ncbi:hypothetical protein HKBW3S34_02329, partial [Candidatus Hakubella thermalkaliphila]
RTGGPAMSASKVKQSVSIWYIDRSKTWPPRGWVQYPISPSLYELLRTCWLQATFQASASYPRRSSPYARLGTAFPRTLEQLRSFSWTTEGLSSRVVRAQAVEIFRAAVEEQKQEAMRNPRERGLPWLDDLMQRMEVAIALVADQLAVKSSVGTYTGSDLGQWSKTAVEETLVSVDGLLQGRPDLLVEDRVSGTIIVDYKTGSLDDPDRLTGYERQCLLYAWLWHERYGTWPVEYRLVNPIKGHEYRAPVKPEVATALAEDARRLARRLAKPPWVGLQASPGPHCSRCPFRPWCEPFWQHVASGTSEVQASTGHSRVSMQGTVLEMDRLKDAGARKGLVRV